MKHLSFFLLSILLASLSYAQGYYPLKVGNAWTYRDTSYFGDSTSVATITVFKDTAMPNGKTYAYLSNGLFLRQQGDSVYSYNSGMEGSLYYFTNKEVDTLNFSAITRSTCDVFGTLKTVWEFRPTMGTAESILDYEVIADSIGLVVEGGFYGNSSLIRANIDGVQYSSLTAIQNSKNSFPSQYSLEQNYPNPFNPVTTISFALPRESFVLLKVYDLLGREVATLTSEQISSGDHAVRWDASSFPSGVYLYRMQANNFTQTRKLILLK